MTAYEFAPGRLVLATGERVRPDPDAPDLLLSDFSVLSPFENEAAGLAVLRLASRGHIQERLDRAQSDYDMAARKRSGKPWTEEQYKEAGIQLLHIRLRPEDHEPLDELAELWGLKRGEAVKRAIAEAHARHVAPYARRGAEQAPDAQPDQSAVLTREPLNNRSGGQKSDLSKKKST